MAFLPALLGIANPSAIEISFRRDLAGNRSVCLTTQFRQDCHSDLSLFRETLVWLEGQIGFICEFDTKIDEHGFLGGPVHSLTISPGDMILPSGKPFSYIPKLSSLVPSISELARAHRIPFSYRVQLEPRESDLALAKSFIPTLVELERTSSSKSDLFQAQKEVILTARNRGWFARESVILGADDWPLHRSWVERCVRLGMAERYPFAPSDLVELTWSTPDVSGNAVNLDEDLICKSAELRCDNYIELVMEELGYTRGGLDEPIDFGRVPRLRGISAEQRPVVFLSYARANRDLIESVLNMLQEAGIAIWFDKKLDGGAIWDETLEQQIRECCVFVACLSDEYAESRYCRRELKFADLLSKKILPISLGLSIWPDGLAMMFQELQIMMVDRAAGWALALERIQIAISEATEQTSDHRSTNHLKL